MKTNFEVYKILPSGVPVPVQKAEGLKETIITVLRLAIDVRGHYTVCSEHNISEPVFEMNDFETLHSKAEKTWQTFTRN